jgi:RNA polymerase sigma-70 factor (ECF subfamily)
MNVTLAEIIVSLAASPAQAMPDAETTRLVVQARAGSADAFSALIDLHQRAARRVAAAALGDRADVDEAVQEACIVAWRRLDRLEDPAAFRAWLLRITWRKALDRRRSATAWLSRFQQMLSGGRGDTSEVSLAVEDTAMRADDQLLNKERDRIVAQMIRSLPVRLRDPFLLAATGEQRYEDIAAMLRIPIGTVKWRVAEARRVLRDKLTRVGF